MENITVQDVRGRSIEVKKLKTLDRMKVLELIGADNSMNDRYLGFAILAYSVVSIDGSPVPRANSKMALEATVQLLDDDGFDAVSEGIAKNFLATAQTVEEAKDAVKNV
jgi:hypothetical protein